MWFKINKSERRPGWAVLSKEARALSCLFAENWLSKAATCMMWTENTNVLGYARGVMFTMHVLQPFTNLWLVCFLIWSTEMFVVSQKSFIFISCVERCDCCFQKPWYICKYFNIHWNVPKNKLIWSFKRIKAYCRLENKMKVNNKINHELR